MGTDEFAVPALKAVINGEAELACVITQPDRPKGRRLKITPSPIKEVALENNLTLYQPERVREREFIQEVLQSLKPDLIIVAAFGQILPKAILDLPSSGCINLHPSLLPKYRGAAPIQRAIMNGEVETGVTVMFMDEGEDTGDIILQERIEIEVSDSAELLSRKLANLAACMIREALQLAQDGTLPRQPQDHSKALYAPKLRKEDGSIDWEKSALEIHNLIRGTIPWPGAYTTFGEAIQLKIWESQLPGIDSCVPPGTIVDILPDKGIVVATGDMCLLITTVQPASKSRMRARDFVNGYRIKVGDVFS
jgi:methionyl-tRNA formyltransferase